jgi:tellurite resistance protein TerB
VIVAALRSGFKERRADEPASRSDGERQRITFGSHLLPQSIEREKLESREPEIMHDTSATSDRSETKDTQGTSATPSRDSLTCSEVNFEAISSAFALIACADDALGDREIERYRELLKSSEACRGFEIEGLVKRFHEIADSLLDDFAAGKHRALEAIARVSGDERSSRLVIQAAQIAIVADGQLDEVEETMLAEICRTLGVDPEDY